MDEVSRFEDRYQDHPDDDMSYIKRGYQDSDCWTLDDVGMTHKEISTWQRSFLNSVNVLWKYRVEGKVRRYDRFHAQSRTWRVWSDAECARLIHEWN